MGFFKGMAKANRLGKQMAYLKVDHPEAWAAGEEAGIEALQTRSDDLADMLIHGPEERVEQYRASMTEQLTRGIGSDEVEPPFWPMTADNLQAFGIAMGMKILDVLEAERKEGRRRVREVE